MSRDPGPVARMFQALIEAGQITPTTHMEDMRLPGELTFVPSLIGYRTPDAPVLRGTGSYAELGRGSQGD
jgi:hypothetical protein